MSLFVKGFLDYAAKSYRRSLGKKLAEHGLKYEDLLVENKDVAVALTRIDANTLQDRERRIKRAFDLSAKKKYLPEELQTEDPFDSYLGKYINLAEKERKEKELLQLK